MSIEAQSTFFQELIPSSQWVYSRLEKPFLEGVERLRRAIHGVDSHPLNEIPVPLRDRAIYLITGTLLLLPPINFILWIFMDTFLETERLSRCRPFPGESKSLPEPI